MIILLSLIFSFNVTWAQMSQVVRCLAQEEMRIHKSENLQHHFKLNQELINAFSSATQLEVKKELREKICKGHVALNLLEELLIHGKSIFSKESNLIETDTYLRNTGIYSLLQNAPKLFFQYVLSLQAWTGQAGCLEREIPALKKLSEEFQFLQVDVSREDLLKDKKQIVSIFEQLREFPKIKKRCQTKPKI